MSAADIIQEYNALIMSFFKEDAYELVLFDGTNIPPLYLSCLYGNKMPDDNPKALLLINKKSKECVASISFQPWLIDRTTIEIFSFTNVSYRKRGINFIMRLLAILLMRIIYPDSERIISYAESPFSAAANQKIGFQIIQSSEVVIYELVLIPETLQRASQMLVDRIARSRS